MFNAKADYLRSLVRYDAACNVPHRHSREWDVLTPAERDLMDAQLLETVRKNERPITSRTKVRCYEVVAQLMGPLAPTQEEFLRMVERREREDAEARGD